MSRAKDNFDTENAVFAATFRIHDKNALLKIMLSHLGDGGTISQDCDGRIILERQKEG